MKQPGKYFGKNFENGDARLAVFATTIMRQVNAPKPLVSIAEGESLLNDASALIVFRFALAAVNTGQFHFQQAAAQTNQAGATPALSVQNLQTIIITRSGSQPSQKGPAENFL